MKKLIKQNRIRNVLLLLHEHIDETVYPDLINQVILLEARSNRIKDQKRKGIIAEADKNLGLNKLNNDLIEFVEKLPAEIVEREINLSSCVTVQLLTKRYFFYLLIIISAFLFLFGSKKAFKAEMFITLDKVTFQIIHGDQLFHNTNLEAFQMLNFHKILLPADEIRLNENINNTETVNMMVENGLLELYPDLEAEGSDFVIGPAKLIGISGIQGATLALHVNSEVENELVLTVQSAEQLKTELNVPTRSNFSTSLVNVEGWNYKKEVDFISGEIINSVPEKIEIDGDSVISVINLQAVDLEKININDIVVKDIDFLKRDAEKIESTIKNGSIQIAGFDEIFLAEREYLEIEATNYFTISKLTINQAEIQLQLKGTFSKLLVGKDQKQLNPLIISWLFTNHTMKFIGVLLVLIIVFCIVEYKLKFID